jgi:predicted DsbA family dithiol-disulfide isomerase
MARLVSEVSMAVAGKPELLATVFTDYICPFCYVGDVRLDRLRDDYDLRINWCFLEIHPETPSEGMDSSCLGYTDPRWQQMMENLSRLAEEEGITFRPQTFTTNSQEQLARESGVSDAVLSCAWSDAQYTQRLEQYLAAAHELKVRATPTIFFGEQQRIDGALPFDVFQRVARAGADAQQTKPV